MQERKAKRKAKRLRVETDVQGLAVFLEDLVPRALKQAGDHGARSTDRQGTRPTSPRGPGRLSESGGAKRGREGRKGMRGTIKKQEGAE